MQGSGGPGAPPQSTITGEALHVLWLLAEPWLALLWVPGVTKRLEDDHYSALLDGDEKVQCSRGTLSADSPEQHLRQGFLLRTTSGTLLRTSWLTTAQSPLSLFPAGHSSSAPTNHLHHEETPIASPLKSTNWETWKDVETNRNLQVHSTCYKCRIYSANEERSYPKQGLNGNAWYPNASFLLFTQVEQSKHRACPLGVRLSPQPRHWGAANTTDHGGSVFLRKHPSFWIHLRQTCSYMGRWLHLWHVQKWSLCVTPDTSTQYKPPWGDPFSDSAFFFASNTGG